jgi:hypothetical protein
MHILGLVQQSSSGNEPVISAALRLQELTALC